MLAWPALAALALAAGYADLARGGTTLAPVLLVVGYVVVAPLALLRTPGARDATRAAGTSRGP
jgi:hypothetical protein